jgi:wyosine [tRNA(Phe)-imidazoG37] synthetase (radical SAM superfamily)
MNYVFGPVPSRRLGQSLGIDTIPLKTCNWNCVYCQLGRTQPLVHERKAYFPAAEILAEVRQLLDSHQPGEIDWVTFVGSGEPLLHADLGWMLRQVKTMTELPVAVITNGSLLNRPEVREELSMADAVLPTLDAGSTHLFRQINRPYPELTFIKQVNGLVAFRDEYMGNLWVEVMLVRGLNDTPQALRDLARALLEVRPDAVHLTLPVRPPAETWVEPPTEEGLMRAIAILGEIAEVVHPAEGRFDLRGYEEPIDAMLGIITRHPVRQEELDRALMFWPPEEVRHALEELINNRSIQVIERYGTKFFCSGLASYPNHRQSITTKPSHRQIARQDQAGEKGA